MSIQDIIRRDGGATGSQPYECLTCGERYEVEYYVCPECNGFSVERG